MTSDELCACLVDRPCDACKFHTDLGCSKWSCVFEDKIEELPSAEHHKLNVAEYIKDNFADVWKQAEKELEVPSAEPQIIRCKDCIHWKHSSIRPNYCDVWDWCNRADDFCSFAERREEDEIQGKK